MNLVIAQFVVTREVQAHDMKFLLSNTPGHIVIIIFDDNSVSQHSRRIVEDAVRECDRFESQWCDAGAVLSHKMRLKKVGALTSIHDEGANYTGFRFETVGPWNSCTAVAVGVISSDPKGDLSDKFMDDVLAAIEEDKIRFLAGLFGCSRERVEKLRPFPQEFCPTCFFQPWWKPGKEEEEEAASGGGRAGDSAVAARYKLQTSHVASYKVYPAYIVVFGPVQDIGEV